MPRLKKYPDELMDRGVRLVFSRYAARALVTRLADELEHTHPDAAGSLREGVDDSAHGDPAGHHGQAPTHVGVDEPPGVDDRHRAITCGPRAS